MKVSPPSLFIVIFTNACTNWLIKVQWQIYHASSERHVIIEPDSYVPICSFYEK